MAIVVQEEKEPTNWFAIVSTVIIIGLIFATLYYLFFSRPPFIEVVLPIPLAQTVSLSGLTLDPAPVINSDAFRGLRQYGSPPTVGELGRENPFLPPAKNGAPAGE